jgi:hypothetical protein
MFLLPILYLRSRTVKKFPENAAFQAFHAESYRQGFMG